MGRVIWDDGKKFRLSAAAVALLARMCSEGVSIRYEFRAGKYTRIVDGISETVQERTVDALARAGLISRSKDSVPSYVVNERAREFLKRTEKPEEGEYGPDNHDGQ
jgi:NADH dehydrogenase/NADH:ubiquinone oxidoreductase subunit G